MTKRNLLKNAIVLTAMSVALTPFGSEVVVACAVVYIVALVWGAVATKPENQQQVQ